MGVTLDSFREEIRAGGAIANALGVRLGLGLLNWDMQSECESR